MRDKLLNQAIRTFESDNEFGIPEMRHTPVDVVGLLPFSDALRSNDYRKTVSFFLHDYRFERVWNNPERYVSCVSRFNGALSPDFSVFTWMPRAVQIFNVFRSRWVGRYWQEHGVNVIPTITWGDSDTFDFCFKGVRVESVVAVSSVGCCNSAISMRLFRMGYEAMVDILSPKTTIWQGKEVDGMVDERTVVFEPFYRRFHNGGKRKFGW